MTAPVQATFKGVHKSGYHSSYSDQYAAVVTPKKVSSTKTRNFTVHETIQVIYEIHFIRYVYTLRFVVYTILILVYENYY
jgi:hypothetical protein